jgi:hypothetical protein
MRTFAFVVVVVSLWTLVASGCSFIFVTPPPKRGDGGQPPACTASYVAPALDGVFTGYQVFRTVVATKASDEVYRDLPFGRNTDIVLGVAFAATHALSTAYGYNAVEECRRLRSVEAERQAALDRQRRARAEETNKDVLRKLLNERAAARAGEAPPAGAPQEAAAPTASPD